MQYPPTCAVGVPFLPVPRPPRHRWTVSPPTQGHLFLFPQGRTSVYPLGSKFCTFFHCLAQVSAWSTLSPPAANSRGSPCGWLLRSCARATWWQRATHLHVWTPGISEWSGSWWKAGPLSSTPYIPELRKTQPTRVERTARGGWLSDRCGRNDSHLCGSFLWCVSPEPCRSHPLGGKGASGSGDSGGWLHEQCPAGPGWAPWVPCELSHSPRCCHCLRPSALRLGVQEGDSSAQCIGSSSQPEGRAASVRGNGSPLQGLPATPGLGTPVPALRAEPSATT